MQLCHGRRKSENIFLFDVLQKKIVREVNERLKHPFPEPVLLLCQNKEITVKANKMDFPARETSRLHLSARDIARATAQLN